MRVLLIMSAIIAVEFLIMALAHVGFDTPLRSIAVVGIFVGWANAFIYIKISN